MTILQFLADALAVAPVLVTFAISGAVVGAIVAGPMGAGIGILTGLCAGAWFEFATAGRSVPLLGGRRGRGPCRRQRVVRFEVVSAEAAQRDDRGGGLVDGDWCHGADHLTINCGMIHTPGRDTVQGDTTRDRVT